MDKIYVNFRCYALWVLKFQSIHIVTLWAFIRIVLEIQNLFYVLM